MSTIQRSYLPGSQWVYLKLYTGEKTADDLLIQVIAPVVKRLQKNRHIEKWFFIRYADPDFHLRIRLLARDSQFIGEILHLFYQKLDIWNRDRLLWKVQLDTYNRELERYRKHLIEEAESVFCADSACILSILKDLNGNENHRWMIALKLIDELLSDFGLNTEAKQKLMEEVSKTYKTEFGFTEFNAKQFNTKFRDNKKTVESVLNKESLNSAMSLLAKRSEDPQSPENYQEMAGQARHDRDFISLCQPIKKRSRQLKPVAGQIKIKSKKEGEVNELLKSYLHMMINRLFRSNNRLHELILYDFMSRYYASEIAKEKYNKK